MQQKRGTCENPWYVRNWILEDLAASWHCSAMSIPFLQIQLHAVFETPKETHLHATTSWETQAESLTSNSRWCRSWRSCCHTASFQSRYANDPQLITGDGFGLGTQRAIVWSMMSLAAHPVSGQPSISGQNQIRVDSAATRIRFAWPASDMMPHRWPIW